MSASAADTAAARFMKDVAVIFHPIFRAVDFAKFGALFLNGGVWQGKQVISQAWVEASTQPLLPENYSEYYNDWVTSMPQQGYYNFMWWGMVREGGAFDFTAEGDKGLGEQRSHRSASWFKLRKNLHRAMATLSE